MDVSENRLPMATRRWIIVFKFSPLKNDHLGSQYTLFSDPNDLFPWYSHSYTYIHIPFNHHVLLWNHHVSWWNPAFAWLNQHFSWINMDKSPQTPPPLGFWGFVLPKKMVPPWPVAGWGSEAARAPAALQAAPAAPGFRSQLEDLGRKNWEIWNWSPKSRKLKQAPQAYWKKQEKTNKKSWDDIRKSSLFSLRKRLVWTINFNIFQLHLW